MTHKENVRIRKHTASVREERVRERKIKERKQLHVVVDVEICIYGRRTANRMRIFEMIDDLDDSNI